MTSAAHRLDADSMTREQLVQAAYAAGQLRFKCQRHQVPFYDAFWKWDAERQTRAHLDWCASIGARFDNLWMNEWSRRVGKTTVDLLLGHEQSTRVATKLGHGAIGMIAIPVQKKIGGVIVPLADKIFADAPKGYKPEYCGSGRGLHEHLYIPATESRIVLVGTDAHPDALRGTWLDFFAWTEMGFAESGLDYTYTSVIQHQFQGRPWAWALVESSVPEVPDHEWNTIFKPDARLRRAFWEMVITDNTSLTEDQIADEIRRSGGREHPTCKRELFNEVAPDPEIQVLPEFDERVHVVDPRDWIQPQHALCHLGLDPGRTDPFGLVWLYFDWARQTIVVQAAWQKSNASLGEVVNVIKPMEARLWGTDHSTPQTRTPNNALITIRNAQPVGGGGVWEPPHGSCTYWDESSWTLRPNPFSRVSDIDNGAIIDMNRDYALAVRAAEKGPGSAEDDLQHLRMLFGERHAHNGMPKIVILKNGLTDCLIEQCRSGRWKTREDVHRHDWQRSKKLGHLDAFSALKYVVRDIRWSRNPFPPAARDLNAPNTYVPPHIAERMRGHGRELTPPSVLGGFQSHWNER